jgi:predicted signal transduction protein with EAL and GGDEF domain
MKKIGHEGHSSAASETYMPRLELAARLVSAVIVAAFMGWLPLSPLLLPLSLVFASIGAYAAFAVVAGYLTLRGRASAGLVCLALWVDVIAGGALLLNDPFEVPPTIIFLLLAVLGNGLQHGRRLFMHGLAGASATLAVVLIVRQGVLLDALAYPLIFLLLPMVLGTYYFYVVITRIEALKQYAEVRSEEDPLTRLPNRRAFRRAAAYLLHLSHRTGTPLVVMYADFDDFKAINDGHGHAMGDRALCQFADIIRRNIRDAD